MYSNIHIPLILIIIIIQNNNNNLLISILENIWNINVNYTCLLDPLNVLNLRLTVAAAHVTKIKFKKRKPLTMLHVSDKF